MSYTTQSYQDLEDRYAATEKYVEKVCNGQFNALIINGPAGLGKTYSVESCLKKYAKKRYNVFAGHMSLLSLYGTLYNYREAGEIVVLDDIDSVLKDVQGINILKAAMDTKASRAVTWKSTTKLLQVMGIPSSFQFKGAVILISNMSPQSGKSKIDSHLMALKDRSFSITIADSSKDSQFKQVCFMVLKRDLLKSFKLKKDQEIAVLDFIQANLDVLERISLRTAVKLAQLISQDPLTWQLMAKTGVLENFE